MKSFKKWAVMKRYSFRIHIKSKWNLCKCTNVIFHLWNISQVENKSTPKCKSMKTEAYKTLRNKKFENNKRGDKFLGEKLTHTYKHNTLFLRNAEYPS